MTQEKISRLMQQIESQHQALCTDYFQLTDNIESLGNSGEERLERIAHMYWQLRSQMSSLVDTHKIEIEFN